MKKSIAIVGGGPAAMMCAVFLDPLKYNVTIYEKGKALGRKFLVAGKGGFNLTHSENVVDFIGRYTPADFFQSAIMGFDNNELRKWLGIIGIPTFVGSSGRVYPEKNIKPIEVLARIIKALEQNKVNVECNREWSGWVNSELLFDHQTKVKADIVIFALGGASWKVTGSSGDWLNLFTERGIGVLPFQPSNCGYYIKWKQEYIDVNEGQPLKNIAIGCNSQIQKGEAVVTRKGLEGNAIYALSPNIRKQLDADGYATVFLDLKPMLSEIMILDKLKNSRFSKVSDRLKKDLKLSKSMIDLLKSELDKNTFLDNNLLAKSIKNVELKIVNTANLDEAISTVGGICREELNEEFEFNGLANHFCIGEMIDWDAPTGGYLLQGCFSMGVTLAKTLNHRDD